MSGLDKRVVIGTAIVALTAMAVVLAGAAWFANRGSVLSLQDERERLQALQLRVEKASSESVEGAPTAGDRRVWSLLDGPDVVSTLQALQQVADATGITFDSQQTVQAKDPGKQSFVVAGRGTPDEVCAFAAALEQHERLIIIETGRVMPGDGGQIAFEFGLATYHAGGER